MAKRTNNDLQSTTRNKIEQHEPHNKNRDELYVLLKGRQFLLHVAHIVLPLLQVMNEDRIVITTNKTFVKQIFCNG